MCASPSHTAIDDLASYDISDERGFLPDQDPLTELPAAFAAWEAAARDLPKFLLTGRVRSILADLPPFPYDALDGERAVRRAMVVLSYLGHAYVWGEEPAASRIPALIAVPWWEVAQQLGRPPVLSYASYAIDNWRRIDPAGPIDLSNIAIVQNFLGGVDEDWFIAIHVDIEYKAGRILRHIGPALDAAARQNAPALGGNLSEIAHGIEALVEALKRMPDRCDPYVYYHRVRPYIHGWKNHPALPDGVVYEGVAALGERPQRFRGETGAQSGIVPVLDAALGVAHADDPLRTYLMEMRGYMPPAHRAFIEAIEAAPKLRPFVLQAAKSDIALREAYNACVAALEAFRSIHLQYAATYIHQQSQSGAANPTEVGTGGTPFMQYLKKHRDESAVHAIGDRPHQQKGAA